MSSTEVIDTAPDAVIELVTAKRLEILCTQQDLETKHLLKLMADLTKTAIDQQRLKVDKDSSDANKELAAALFKQMVSQGNQNPFEVNANDAKPVMAIEVDDALLDDLPVDEGSLSTELSELNYEQMFG
mgnify:CR=1 FL=1